MVELICVLCVFYGLCKLEHFWVFSFGKIIRPASELRQSIQTEYLTYDDVIKHRQKDINIRKF